MGRPIQGLEDLATASPMDGWAWHSALTLEAVVVPATTWVETSKGWYCTPTNPSSA